MYLPEEEKVLAICHVVSRDRGRMTRLQIARAIGYADARPVVELLEELARKGVIDKIHGVARNKRVRYEYQENTETQNFMLLMKDYA